MVIKSIIFVFQGSPRGSSWGSFTPFRAHRGGAAGGASHPSGLTEGEQLGELHTLQGSPRGSSWGSFTPFRAHRGGAAGGASHPSGLTEGEQLGELHTLQGSPRGSSWGSFTPFRAHRGGAAGGASHPSFENYKESLRKKCFQPPSPTPTLGHYFQRSSAVPSFSTNFHHLNFKGSYFQNRALDNALSQKR